MDTNRSDELFARAGESIPGGVNSPVRAFRAVGRNPLFIRRAEGSSIYDEDGNRYIDYVCSWGPGILGHAHPQVLEAVTRTCRDGLTFGAPTRGEIALAEEIKAAFPSVDLVRLVSSGTEAVMSAVRVARGHTGRDKIIKFRGCYHGHADGLLVKAGSGALTASVPDSAGVPEDYARHTLVAEYNDLDSVAALLAENRDQVAAVVVEPVAANMGVIPPAPGFLEGLRRLTEDSGSLLIFDEVITGFRLAYGGAQAYYGVVPDMTCLGKIVGGGMPMGAFGGRRDIMERVAPLGPVYQAGTLSGNPVAVAAGLETLRLIREDDGLYARLEEKAERLAGAMIGATVNRVGSLVCPFFTAGPVTSYTDAVGADPEAYARYFRYMLARGVYLAPSQFEAMFVSDAHSGEEIDYTAGAAMEFFLQ